MKATQNETVSVFFAADDRYLPFLEVALSSLSDHASDEYLYDIHILTTAFSDKSLESASKTVKSNIKITVDDISEKIEPIRSALSLRLRDYYSESIYYRLFIPSMYPNLKRAVYLDSDIVLLDDVAKLYFAPLFGKILGAVTDESVMNVPVFRKYVRRYVGMPMAKCYFNSGVLVMNLEGMRRERIEEKFRELLLSYNFKTVAPDQDYLNFLCKGKVKYLSAGWNKHAIVGRDISLCELHLVHFNMFNKPWHYDNVPYEEYFWRYADKTASRDFLKKEKSSYTDEKRKADFEAAGRLVASADEIYKSEPPLSERLSGEDFFAVCPTLGELISKPF